MIKELARILLESLSSESNTAENKEQLRKLLARLRQRHPEIFSEVSSDVVNKRDEDNRTQTEQLILSLSVVSAMIMPVDHLLMPHHLDKPRFYAVNGDGRQSWRPHNRICGLGSEYTCSGSAKAFGGKRR